MRHQLDSLHGDLNQSRLVPFGTLAGRFVQPITTLSQRHNKAVELAIEGESVAVDQAVLEQLRTPLTHLLRNAFDHGIELPQERIAQGKTRTGKIRLIATQKSNFVTITVADDGRGVNLEKVYQRALAKRLCSPETRFEQLTQEQILEFLFRPGFSTAATVGSLSGRGVGLDIVRSDVERLHGSLRIETEPGWGSQFIIRIPLTLNILPLLLCRSHQRCLAVPAENVNDVINISDFPTETTDETGLVRRLHWHNQWLPLVSLQQLLPYQQSMPAEGAAGLPNIGIVLSMNDKYLVAAIDEMLGERRLVVKPFDSVVPIPLYLAGCTVLGTGEVVPIVVPDYFEELLAGLHAQAPTKHPPVAIAGERPSILVVDDSIAVRRTLNRLLTQAGYQVLQCRDGQEAWEVLNQQNMAFNLAICDLEMPRMDGFTLLQKIRASGYKELPVVVLTSRESDLHRKKASQLGANGYMTKPFHPVAFLEEISDFLQPVASA
ncbi:MAG: response regulator [Chloroflexaceae bacterium]|nr:response regulator [Chloroflexaceae bacterium]